MAGLGGAYMAVAYTPLWTEGMTAGRGWIALALVVFATWSRGACWLGAYLFGGVTLAQFQAQALGVAVPSQFLSMLPYLATIVVLVLISRDAHGDPAQRAGVARQAVPSRRLMIGRRQNCALGLPTHPASVARNDPCSR